MNNIDLNKKRRIVIKLSGSIFNTANGKESITKYARMLLEISDKFQPVVVTGGGEIARHYINIARSLGSDEANLDIIGIEVSRLNAKLLLVTLGDQAFSQVPKNLEEVALAAASGKIVIAGGLHPGQSTNATSALIAETVKASKFLNVTDVDGIYDSDPKTNRDAKLFKKITVKECMEILGNESSMAGTYELIDIVALKVIERSKIPTQVLRSNVNNIKHAINNNSKYHVGTEIVIDPALTRAATVKKRS
jgi:uridylate kinase